MTEAQALGKPYWEVFPPGTGPMPGCKAAMDRKGQGGSQEEVSVGEKLFLSKSYTARDDQGKSLHALHILSDITAQRQAEGALWKSKDLLQSIMEHVPARIFWKDRDSRYLGCNTQFAKDAGHARPDELTGKTDFEMGWKDQAEFYRADDKAVMESGKPKLDYEEPQTTPDGNTIWLSTSKVPLRDESKQVIGMLGLYQDITERKRGEESLRQREVELNESQRVAHIGSWNWDALNETIRWSDEYYRIYGLDPKQPTPNYADHLKAYSPESAQRLDVVAKRAMETGEPYEVDLELARPTPVTRWIVARGEARRDASGKIWGLRGTAQNITEKKWAEDALRENQARLDLALRSARMGVWHFDMIENRRYFDDQVCRLLGLDPATFTGATEDFFGAVHPDDRETIKAALARTMEQDIPYEPEYRAVWPDGSVHYITARGRLVRDDKGRPARINGIMWDVSARKQDELALARANRALRTLSACNDALVHNGNESELLDSICRLIVEVGGYRMAWVGFPEQDPAKTVRPVTQYGHDEEYLEAVNISWADSQRGHGPTGTAMRTGTVQVNQNFLTNPALTLWREVALPRGYHSSIALPLKSSTGALGVLTIYASETDAFNEAEVILLQELAGDLAFGIETLRTHAERDRIAHENLHHSEILQQSLEDSIKAIADTVEMRDPYTAGHQRRVGQLAAAIARELGLSEDTSRGIELAASVHDLGKISVPAEILSKPSKLTAIELMLLKNHAQAGFDILKDIKFPWPIATMVLQHHERLDGSGYPQGLKGEKILLESRIMAVADVVEAMASHRPYRAALGIDSALKEIERGRGTAFDAAVVDACTRLFAEKRFAFSS